jgi:hypothetical protein
MSSFEFSVKELELSESPVVGKLKKKIKKVSFQSAPPSLKEISKIQFDLLNNEASKKRKLESNQDHIDYEGVETHQSNYAIGILNKTKNKIKIIPISKYIVEQTIQKEQLDEVINKKDFVSARVQRMSDKDRKFNVRKANLLIKPSTEEGTREYIPPHNATTEIRSEVFPIEGSKKNFF